MLLWVTSSGFPLGEVGAQGVRRGLEALIARPVFYELVEMAEARETAEGPQLGVASGGAVFVSAASITGTTSASW